MLIGPSGSGKVQLIKVQCKINTATIDVPIVNCVLFHLQGIGQLCGRFLLILHSCTLTDKSAIAKTFEGLSQDGCWVCFSDAHALSMSALSVLSQMMQTVTLALQAKKTICHLPCGREVSDK